MRVRLILGTAVCLILFGSSLRAAEADFDSHGTKIHYYVEGKGEPVLLIHGFAANTQFNWVLPGIVKNLAKQYQVIAFDNRGHGRSGKPHEPEKYGMEMVEDAIRLLDHLKIKKAHLVGYSMGAMIANKLIVTHPDRFLSATLGGGAAKKQNGDDQFIRDLTKALDEGKGIGPVLVALTPIGYPKPNLDEVQARSKFLMLANDAKALSALVRRWKDLAVTEDELKACKVPILGLVGSIDPLKTRLEALKGKMPNYRLVEIDGADHMDAVGRPEFINTLKDFLTEHSAAKK